MSRRSAPVLDSRGVVGSARTPDPVGFRNGFGTLHSTIRSSETTVLYPPYVGVKEQSSGRPSWRGIANPTGSGLLNIPVAQSCDTEMLAPDNPPRIRMPLRVHRTER